MNYNNKKEVCQFLIDYLELKITLDEVLYAEIVTDNGISPFVNVFFIKDGEISSCGHYVPSLIDNAIDFKYISNEILDMLYTTTLIHKDDNSESQWVDSICVFNVRYECYELYVFSKKMVRLDCSVMI